MNHLCCLTISAAFCHAAKARNSQKNSLQNQLHSLFCPFVSPYYLADVDAESQYDGEEYEDDGGEEDDEEERVLAEETLQVRNSIDIYVGPESGPEPGPSHAWSFQTCPN